MKEEGREKSAGREESSSKEFRDKFEEGSSPAVLKQGNKSGGERRGSVEGDLESSGICKEKPRRKGETSQRMNVSAHSSSLPL